MGLYSSFQSAENGAVSLQEPGILCLSFICRWNQVKSGHPYGARCERVPVVWGKGGSTVEIVPSNDGIPKRIVFFQLIFRFHVKFGEGIRFFCQRHLCQELILQRQFKVGFVVHVYLWCAVWVLFYCCYGLLRILFWCLLLICVFVFRHMSSSDGTITYIGLYTLFLLLHLFLGISRFLYDSCFLNRCQNFSLIFIYVLLILTSFNF